MRPYAVANALIESTSVYTNNPPCGAMRGFGAVQTCFAAEAQMDKLAQALELDPVELRLRNALAHGDRLPTGQRIEGSLPVAEVIRRAAELPVPEPEAAPRDPIRLPGGAGNTTRGEGVRGRRLRRGLQEHRLLRRLRRLLRRARPPVRGWSSRSALRGGRGRAGRDERDPPGCSDGARYRGRRPGAAHDRVRGPGGLRVGFTHDLDGRRRRPARMPRRARGAGEKRRRRVDVERIYRHRPTSPLDPATGQTTGERSHRCLRLRGDARRRRGGRRARADAGCLDRSTAQDVGKAINPQAVEGQIEGGTAQGLGLAVMEEIQTRDGVITNASFTIT